MVNQDLWYNWEIVSGQYLHNGILESEKNTDPGKSYEFWVLGAAFPFT